MKKRLVYFFRGIIGLLLKYLCLLGFLFRFLPKKLDKNSNVVISLTSYGRRVRKTVPYTIYYLFMQKLMPSRIILWLDKEKWNEENLPSKLKFLCKHGLEIEFCEDIRSYTKLIYTLKLCPNSKIVTVDDDIIYSRNLLCELVYFNNQNPKKIISLRFHKPSWDEFGKSLTPYNQWNNSKLELGGIQLFPTGVGGVLYPPDCFTEEVFNRNVFAKICPYADDVWFWAMEILKGTEVVGVGKIMYFPMNSIFQKMHKGDSLQQVNVGSSENDKQIKAVLDHYQLWDKIKK